MTDPKPHPYVPSGFFMSHVVNPITLRLGGPTLTVAGRRTGRPISTPVPPFEYGGARYLVSGGGETHWVRNLRAAGQGELRRGRTLVIMPGTRASGPLSDLCRSLGCKIAIHQSAGASKPSLGR